MVGVLQDFAGGETHTFEEKGGKGGKKKKKF